MTAAPRRSWPSRLALVLGLCGGLAAERAPALAALGDECAVIRYVISFNGQEAPEEGRILVDGAPDAARVRNIPAGILLPGAPRESGYIDYAAQRTCQMAELGTGERFNVTTEFPALPVLEFGDEQMEILGYDCRKATTVLRSNRLEIWFTRETRWKGSPSLNLLVPDGLVLKIVRNGNHEITAVDIRPGDCRDTAMPEDRGQTVDAAEYRARVAAGWVSTVPIFRDEQICFDPAAVDTLAMRAALRAGLAADSSAVLRFSAGTVLLRKVRLPRVEGATLLATLVERSNGDAYDRTGSIFLVPVERQRSLLDALQHGVGVLPAMLGRDGRTYQGIAATDEYLPPLELIRFITPFGVGHFNEQVKVKGLTWADSAVYRMDLSALLPVLQGPVWIGAFVGNYDKGGHRLSLSFSYHPDSREQGAPPDEAGWALPLFNTVNLLEMSGQEYGRIFARDTLSADFELPRDVRGLRLRYLATGHGGWGGGDEFNPKRNTLLLDGRELAALTPWRSDCASYRDLNPASGNFWNGLSSSDLSRSGWCPGAAAEPVMIPLPDLPPGRHRLQVAIPLGEPEGESFSAWNVSGVLLGTVARP